MMIAVDSVDIDHTLGGSPPVSLSPRGTLVVAYEPWSRTPGYPAVKSETM